jgi:RimJ/RimL family protein N-acetyltransferase
VILSSQANPRLEFELAVILRGTKQLAGAASIHISNIQNKEGWIGYCLNKRYWGQGIATEAALALVDFGFKKLNLHRIYATVDPENLASASVLQKSGMQYEGRFRDHKLVRGKWRDSKFFAVIESDLFNNQERL